MSMVKYILSVYIYIRGWDGGGNNVPTSARLDTDTKQSIFNLLRSREYRQTKTIMGTGGTRELCESRGGRPSYSVRSLWTYRNTETEQRWGEMLRADTYHRLTASSVSVIYH